MSGGFKFKITLGKAPEPSGTPRLGSNLPGSPSSEAPHGAGTPHDPPRSTPGPEPRSPAGGTPGTGAPPSTGFKFKIKVAGSSGNDLTPHPPASRQAPKIAVRAKSLLGGGGAGTPRDGRPAPKRIKLATGGGAAKPASRTPSTLGNSVIRLATRATLLGSQTPYAPGAGAGTPAHLATPGSPTHRTPSSLPIVRFTVPTKGPKPAETPTPATAPPIVPRRRGRPPGSKNKRRNSSDDEEDGDYAAIGMGELLGAPSRTFNLRSTAVGAISSGGSLGGGGSSPSASLALSGGHATTTARGGGGGEESTAVSGPAFQATRAPGAPRREALEKVVNRIQKKDTHNIFAEPVTDDVAPGYSAMIKEAMDFTLMRRRVAEGYYSTWDLLDADLQLMFRNAREYNPPGSEIHTYSGTLAAIAGRIVGIARTGRTDFRAAGASEARKANAAARAAERAARDAARAAARAEHKAAQEAKVLRKAGVVDGGVAVGAGATMMVAGLNGASVSSLLPSANTVDEHERVRMTYRPRIADPVLASWRGLGAGASAEGDVRWADSASGLGAHLGPRTRVSQGLDAYIHSLRGFCGSLAGSSSNASGGEVSARKQRVLHALRAVREAAKQALTSDAEDRDRQLEQERVVAKQKAQVVANQQQARTGGAKSVKRETSGNNNATQQQRVNATQQQQATEQRGNKPALPVIHPALSLEQLQQQQQVPQGVSLHQQLQRGRLLQQHFQGAVSAQQQQAAAAAAAMQFQLAAMQQQAAAAAAAGGPNAAASAAAWQQAMLQYQQYIAYQQHQAAALAAAGGSHFHPNPMLPGAWPGMYPGFTQPQQFPAPPRQ